MGWLTYKLGDICDFQGGSQPPKSVFIQEEKDGYIRLLQIRDFKSDDKAIYIPEAKKNRICKNDDVMLARYGASVGQVHRGKSGAYNVALIKTIPNTDIIDKDFLYLYLHSESFQKRLMSVAERSAQAGFSKADISPFEVSVPPIPEQKRIVAILDQAFADIEQARAKTEQNLKNARELFESYLQQVFSQHGDDWGVKKIAEIAETCLGKMLDKKKNKGNPKPYLRNQNVQWFNINTDDLLEMRFEDSEYERYAIKKGDLVICEGGYPGRGAIWEQDEDIFFQKALHRIRCHNPLYNRWVLYYLYLSDCNGTLKNSFTGAGIQHFTGKSLKQLALPIPPVELTEKFVRNFDELFNHVISLEHVYHNKLNSIDELKKSILQKAFSGELTKEKEGAVA
ncbi:MULTISPECIES: restriction endonuclease subunit S [Pseudoalteromonas]|jgi:type I restriction enzyme S subunit|nr:MULTISPECIES: restriction endonuclease subunit S [Pseudoalteromonas]CAH9060299.1 Type-1 restriction enzyme EcoKI specificity protein [Pseudoalteromonas haloplanktis]|tara:strand:- start:44965 stop:46152 length:1188 start_codon:yes stop_codon:yes gene_type:complete